MTNDWCLHIPSIATLVIPVTTQPVPLWAPDCKSIFQVKWPSLFPDLKREARFINFLHPDYMLHGLRETKKSLEDSRSLGTDPQQMRQGR